MTAFKALIESSEPIESGKLVPTMIKRAPHILAIALALLATTTTAAALDVAVQRARSDLAARLDAPESSILTVGAEARVWRDASMGCGRPNESYAQIEVSGYRIVLEYNGQRFDYRVRDDGVVVRCESRLKHR